MPANDLLQSALALQRSGRHADALAQFDLILAQNPDDAEMLTSRANTLALMGKAEEALAAYGRVLALRPDAAAAYYYRGNLLAGIGRHPEALVDYNRAAALEPRFDAAFLGIGVALEKLNRPGDAVTAYDHVLSLRPGSVEAFFRRGNALVEMGRLEDAVQSYDRALALAPGQANFLNNRSLALQKLLRFADAAKGYEAVLALEPAHRNALGGLANAAAHACDWSRRDELLEKIRARIGDGTADMAPGMLLAYSGDPALLLQNARQIQARRFGERPPSLWRGTPFSGDRIRLAYCSADFNAHATAHLMAELFERHDRARFEVIGICFSEDDDSPMRGRLAKAFDQFHPVQRQSDADIASLIAGLGVDIALDLKGFTGQARMGIFARRPAPVQVNYLGYPGTLGADYMDYILGDRIVLPQSLQPFYAERIVALPDCYQPNCSSRESAVTPSRAEAGLPHEGFVFCCFNNNWKISPKLFDVWMRLLAAVPGSLLWLLRDNEEAAANLRREAAARDIEPERLVFAPRLPHAAHMARHALADLFLDTLPYNAHTTASDCMLAGVPLVTCLGENFQGRVAASIVTAMGLDELVTENLAAYEKLALALARDPARLAQLEEKLRQNRATTPLFDTQRFTRGIEAAFIAMRDAWRAKNPV